MGHIVQKESKSYSLHETHSGRHSPIAFSDHYLIDEVADRASDPDTDGEFVHDFVLLMVPDLATVATIPILQS